MFSNIFFRHIFFHFRPCSHFANRCRSEMSFAADRLRVHTALMLSVTQIGAIPLCSKKWSLAISE